MRRATPLVAAVGGAIVAVAGSFLPWIQSGAVRRSGYVLARDAWGAGLADVRLGKALLVAWLLTPVAAAGAWTAASLDRRRAAGILAAATGAVAGTAAIAVLASPAEGRFGIPTSLFGAVVAVAGGIWLMWRGRQADE